ncbi:MAG: hypothetical protein N2C14_29365, partial [Planctomycetales bacterium]
MANQSVAFDAVRTAGHVGLRRLRATNQKSRSQEKQEKNQKEKETPQSVRNHRPKNKSTQFDHRSELRQAGPLDER